MAIPSIMANFESSLAGKISATASALVLATGVDNNGDALDGTYYLTVDEGTNSEEHMIVTLAGSAGTIVTRGISRVDGVTEESANKFAHDRGASVKITNMSLIRVVNRLNGEEAFDDVELEGVASIDGLDTPTSGETEKAANVDYVNEVAIAGAPDAAENVKGIVEMATLQEARDGATSGGTTAPIVLDAEKTAFVRQEHITKSYQYGEDITAGQVLYLKTADSKWWKASAANAATADGVFGVAYSTGSTGAYGTVYLVGSNVSGVSGLTPGWQYLSDTPGGISATAGTYKKVLGYAPDATHLFFFPGLRAEDLAGGNTDVTTANLNKACTNITDLTDGGVSVLHGHPMKAGITSRTNAEGTGTQDIAHGLSVAPRLIKIRAWQNIGGGTDGVQSDGFATAIDNEGCISMYKAGANGIYTAGTIIYLYTGASNKGQAEVSAIDATNFTLNWTTVVGDTTQIIWEAYA